jgi:hypothetical protein
MMRIRPLLGSLLFMAASVLNPAYFAGCGMGEEEYQFDAADMLALLEKANGSFEVAHAGATYRVEVQIEAEPEPAASASLWGGSKALACGNRQLYATASACSDSSSLSVRGHLAVIRLAKDRESVVFDGPFDSPATLGVNGLKLSNGSLYLQFAGGSFSLSSRDGKTFDRTDLVLRPEAP